MTLSASLTLQEVMERAAAIRAKDPPFARGYSQSAVVTRPTGPQLAQIIKHEAEAEAEAKRIQNKAAAGVRPAETSTDGAKVEQRRDEVETRRTTRRTKASDGNGNGSRPDVSDTDGNRSRPDDGNRSRPDVSDTDTNTNTDESDPTHDPDVTDETDESDSTYDSDIDDIVESDIDDMPCHNARDKPRPDRPRHDAPRRELRVDREIRTNSDGTKTTVIHIPYTLAEVVEEARGFVEDPKEQPDYSELEVLTGDVLFLTSDGQTLGDKRSAAVDSISAIASSFEDMRRVFANKRQRTVSLFCSLPDLDPWLTRVTSCLPHRLELKPPPSQSLRIMIIDTMPSQKRVDSTFHPDVVFSTSAIESPSDRNLRVSGKEFTLNVMRHADALTVSDSHLSVFRYDFRLLQSRRCLAVSRRVLGISTTSHRYHSLHRSGTSSTKSRFDRQSQTMVQGLQHLWSHPLSWDGGTSQRPGQTTLGSW